MQKHVIRGQNGSSEVMVGERLANLDRYISPARPVILTDENVWRLHGREFPAADVVRIGTGERIKTLDAVHDVIGQLVAVEADRSTCIVGIGGGIVCDIAGFTASVYLRGVRFGFVATTLLAQVDASVGGKNGVNFGGYKNMIGLFSQPEFVICDPDLLHTLPGREIGCGMAEIVKHAAIADERMFALLENNADRARALDREIIEALVSRSVAIKAAVVGRDERERGERRKLNFGHTLGHAAEKTLGLPHGEAVAIGMVAAAALAVRRGVLAAEALARLEALLRSLALPTRLPADPDPVLAALSRDKKRVGDRIYCVLLQAIGQAVVQPITLQTLAAEFSQIGLDKDRLFI